MKSGITAHMIVKNEDQWVYYAIHSVLPHVDTILITDTGSNDKTVKVIKSIRSKKIHFNEIKISTRDEIASVRQSQIDQTKTNWIWIVDADEIYTEAGAKEIVKVTNDSKYSLIVVRRYDLLGDIYHRQTENVGSYRMFGQTGHLLVRLLSLTQLPGLKVRGKYPLESYYTQSGKCVNNLNNSEVYITKNSLYHTMYLTRSSLGGNLPMFNRGKYKIETGIVVDQTTMPEVFGLKSPAIVGNPLKRRSLAYNLIAAVVTPIKNLKRKIL